MRGTGCESYQRSISRRMFLGAGMGGLSLPAVLQARGLAALAGQIPPSFSIG